MTVEEYRNRLMDAFHNADCDELIAVVVRPEESEFKHLEWLLKNHYHNQKQQPCEDAVSRHDALNCVTFNEVRYRMVEDIKALPPVTPKEKTAHWINKTLVYKGETEGERDCYAGTCSACGTVQECWHYCSGCGARMVGDTDGKDSN